jgi:predicted Fe-Mo cluster-binding NifX family protein
MRIAVPVTNGLLAQHFGHCEKFTIVDVDDATRQITASAEVEAPPHQPGLLPPWLGERGVHLVIAGGMGPHAQGLFQKASIEVVMGAPTQDAITVVQQYLAGTLVTGQNGCDHQHPRTKDDTCVDRH